MSIRIMASVFDLQLDPTLKLVLLAYADHADHEGGNIYPAVETVASKTSLSARTVQRATRDLEAKGLLVQTGVSRHGTKCWQIISHTIPAPPERPAKEEEPKKEPESKEENNRRFHVAKALADVTGMNYKLNSGRLLKEAKELCQVPEVTAGRILLEYGPGSLWYQCYPGVTGSRPMLTQIRSTWGTLTPMTTARSGRPIAPVQSRRDESVDEMHIEGT